MATSAALANEFSYPTPESQRKGTCFVCGSQDDRVVVEDNGFFGRACDCGVVYVDPWPGNKALAATHDFHVDTYYAYPAKKRFAYLDQMCQMLLPSGSKKILEVGPGPGYTLQLAREKGYEVHSIEPNPHSADMIDALNIPNERAMIEESQIEDGQFDAVYHVDLMSHFADPVKGLQSMARLLKPEGVLCFEVGIFGGLSDRWYKMIGQVGYPQHPWLYSETALRNVFDTAGLDVVNMRKYNLFPGTMLSTFGMAFFKKLFPKPKSNSGKPAKPNAIYSLYGKLQYHLRYNVGRIVPSFGGPACCFVTLKPKQSALKIYDEETAA